MHIQHTKTVQHCLPVVTVTAQRRQPQNRIVLSVRYELLSQCYQCGMGACFHIRCASLVPERLHSIHKSDSPARMAHPVIRRTCFSFNSPACDIGYKYKLRRMIAYLSCDSCKFFEHGFHQRGVKRVRGSKLFCSDVFGFKMFSHCPDSICQT